MNIIKGLMIKDLLQLKSYKRTLIMYLIIFIFVSLSQKIETGMNGMLVVMMTLGFGMFSIASFSYDEMAKADRYILTLPVTKKQVVLSKYIFVVIATIMGSVIGTILSFAITFIMSKQFPNIQELVTFALGGIFGIGLIECLQIPCIYKYGAEKGRMQIFMIMILLAFVIGGIVWIGEKMSINLSLDVLGNILNQYLPVILLIATAMIYMISYSISYRIYRKKEI